MALNFLSNGIFAGDVTIPEYIYHTGNTSQDKFGFAGNDTFVISTNGTDKFTADANSAILLEAGITKLQTTSTGVGITGTATATTFSGAVSTGNVDGQANIPFKLSVDYNSYMVAAAGTTWGLFWAGNSGARYGTNGNGGPGNIWGNSGNPNEFVFVGGDSTRWTVNGNSGDTWQSGDIYVGGGDIILSGTGRIQGVDTVSANTDAANKLYVDNAVAASPQGTVTISGTPVNNQLAVWTSATSIEGESELTYDGNTFTVGGTGNTTTYLDVIGTNTAGAPATAAAIRIYGYEGRGEGIFYYDSAYASSEWYSGVPYSGGDTWQIGHDTGGQAQYTANALLRFTTAGAATFSGNITMLQTSGNNTLTIDSSGGGNPVIYLEDPTRKWGQFVASGDLYFKNETTNVNTLLLSGSDATFAGSLTIPDYVIHAGDTTTRFGFAAADTFQIDTDGSLRFGVNNSGMKLGGANARVTTIYDQDNMSSNSATALATQQSIKQYVDTAVSNAGTVTGTGSAGRVAFWNGTSAIASSSNLYWDNASAELGVGTSSPTTSFTIQSGHSTTRANLYYNGSTNANNAYIDMWASEPGVTYNGSGIGSNINGSPYYGRKVTEQGQTYIRFIDGQFEVYTGTNSSGTSSTAVRRLYIEDNGLATFSTTPEVGTRSVGDNTGRAASTAFVTTAIGNVDTGVQSVSDDGGSTINVSGSTTQRVVTAVTGAVSSSSANLATGAQIQTAINTAIGTIPSGLAFEGNWDASTGNPPSSSPSNGQFWIVTVAGSTSLSGITDWKVGDWAIYVEQGAGTDAWQKVDNTSTLSGDGVANQLTYWTSTSNVAGDTGLTYNASTNKLTVAGNLSAAGYNIFGLGLSTGSWYGDLGSNGYTRETGLQMTSGSEFVVVSKNGQGSTLVDGAYLAYESANGFFGSYNSTYGNLTGIRATAANTLTVTQLDGGTANLAITSIANATTDTDKFLVSDSGVVKYRTGAQVLSDIGAQASGNYLPVANPTFTGTLTGPTVRVTSGLSVDGAMLAGNTFSDPDLVLTVLDTDTTQSIRDKINDTTAITKVSDSTAPAPGVFAVDGANYPQGFGPFYTIDEGDTFTFEFWVKKESGAATSALLYAGSNFYNASGTYLGNSQRYWGESGLQLANFTDWYHVSGTLGPTRGSSTSQIPTTAVSMRLLFLFNYNPNASIVTHYCGLKVYKSSKTVTQLYRKTLGSEANTTRNRDLVVDQNGDLYGSNLTITGNLIGNTSNTTELGTYSTGAIKRIRMCQGGELHFGDTTTSAPLGITEGQWNSFSDQDRLSIYGRSSITFYAGSTAAVLAATLQSTGLTLNTITNATADTDKFLVSDSGVIKYRTGAQVLSDIGAASSGSLGNYLPLAGGTMSGTINSTATTALQMDGAASAQGILMRADSSGTYPVFLREQNPASGGETSSWLFKDAVSPWGIWHNNPNDSFDWTRAGNNLGIANNVGGETNSVMIRLRSADGSGTFAGNVTATGDVTADQFFSTNNGNGQNYKIGDDVYIGDINVANTFRVQGAQTPANGYITFGNSSNTQLGRAGTGPLTWGGNFEVSGTTTLNNQLTFPYAYLGDYIYHTGDGNTYFGFPSNDIFRVVTGGTARFEITTSTVNVSNASFKALGALATGPGMAETGVGLGQASNYAHAQFSGSAGGYIDFAEPNVDWSGRIIYTHSSDSMVFYTATTAVLTLDSSNNATFTGNIVMGDNDITGIDELLWSSGTKIGDDGAGLLKLTSAASTESGIRFDDADGQLQGYVYGDGGAASSFGLLDGTGQWAVRCLENQYVELRYDNAAKFQTLTDGVYVAGKLGIGTSTPDTDGYGYAEDLVIKGGASAQDGAGITIAGNGKRYGVIAFGDAADVNAGEIFYDHNINALYFRTNGSGYNVFINSAGKVTAGAATSSSDGSSTLTTKGYVDAHPGSGGTVTSVATGGGLDGGTITNAGTIEVEYDGVPTNIIQSGFDFTGDTVVSGDYIMISDPGSTTTNRRIGYVTVGDLPFTNNSGDITSVTAGTGLTGGGTSGGVTLNVDYLGSDSIIKAAPTLSAAVASSDFLLMAASNGNVFETTFSNLPFVSSNDSTVIRTTGGQTRQGNNTFAATSTSTSYTNAGVELRESNLSGSSGTAPFISWHWGGVVASSMAIEANGTIAVRNNPGTAYEKFACGNLTAHGGTFVLGSGGVGDMYIGNNATNKYFRFHTNNNQTYFDMNCGTINWREGSSTRYYFYPSSANMTINGTLTQNSDERVKENIVEINDCIGKVQAMKGVYYNRTDFNTEVTKVGVIAQDVEAVLPELILEAPDTGLKSVAYAELTAVLINAIKEQQEIIEDLKTRVQQLEK